MLKVIYSFFIVMWELICCKIYMEAFIENKSKEKNILCWGLLFLAGIVICVEVLMLGEHFVYKEMAVIVTNTLLWTLVTIQSRTVLNSYVALNYNDYRGRMQ